MLLDNFNSETLGIFLFIPFITVFSFLTMLVVKDDKILWRSVRKLYIGIFVATGLFVLFSVLDVRQGPFTPDLPIGWPLKFWTLGLDPSSQLPSFTNFVLNFLFYYFIYLVAFY